MENELSRVVDSLPGLVWTARPDGHIDFLNRRWCEYTGLGVTQAFGTGWHTAIHPEDLRDLLERWRSILAAGKPGEMEARLRRFDGTYRWFLFRANPLADAAGQVVKWCGLSTDIEERRRGEETLLAGEKQFLEMVAWGYALPVVLEALCRLFEDTVTACHCSVVLVDPGGGHLQAGAAPGLPNSFNESIHGRPLSTDSSPCAMAAFLNEQVIAPDIASERRWVASGWCALALSHGLRACWSTPISSTSGKVLGTLAIYCPVPRAPTQLEQSFIVQFTHLASIAIERAQSESALKRSEAFLAEAQRLSLTGSFSWRVSTDEITWSEQVYRIFELDPAVPVTLDLLRSRVHPEDMPLVREKIDRARRNGGDFEYEHRLQMPDRSVKYLHLVARGTRDADGQLEYIGAIQDVTQRRLSEEALGKIRSELAHVARVTSLGALTASIAHEVNQPLSGIITNASTCLRMLAADPPNVDGARETARRTIRDGNRASDVITRLRALFGKQSATTESVDLNEATREVIALSLSELQRGRVILRAELAEDLPPVTGDRVQLQQVILNLLLNASDAMSGVDDRPRQLLIRTERDEEERVRLTVQDAGVGFDPRHIERLFEAFYTTKSGGMGIGLSVSRSIIESHHGRLWAEPQRWPGRDVFVFHSPASPGAIWTQAATDAERVLRKSVMVIRSLVSVVDDDESVRESLPDLLREFGFAVQAFSSAEEFLASDCVDKTRCLILDIAMPGMSGLDLQRELTRRRQRFRSCSSPLTRMRPCARACSSGCRGVPVQAIQRDGTAWRAQCRTSSDLRRFA